MRLTNEELIQIIKEELEIVLETEEMPLNHPDYDMVAGIIQRVVMAVLTRGSDVESAMDNARVPEEHRDYVRTKVNALTGG